MGLAAPDGSDRRRQRPVTLAARGDEDLAGRELEVGRVWHLLQTVAHGRSAVAMVVGEPGIGKTRLLDAVARRAVNVGAAVLRGGASEAEGMPPYLPFLEALGRYARTAPADVLREQVSVTGAMALKSLLPELSDRLGPVAAAPVLPPEQARARLYDAVGDLLAAIGSASPAGVLLVLDDLQWADAASLDLLVHLVRTHSDARLLVLGACRAAARAEQPALDRALVELNRLRVLVEVALGPLPPAAIGELAVAQLGGAVEGGLTQLLHAHSEGNPFFAEELVRTWRESGHVAERAGVWRVDGARGPAPLPTTITAAVRQRVGRLPSPVAEHLQVGAIVGRAFHVELLAEVTGRAGWRTPSRPPTRPWPPTRLPRPASCIGRRWGCSHPTSTPDAGRSACAWAAPPCWPPRSTRRSRPSPRGAPRSCRPTTAWPRPRPPTAWGRPTPGSRSTRLPKRPSPRRCTWWAIEAMVTRGA
jgi:hypothetical protein